MAATTTTTVKYVPVGLDSDVNTLPIHETIEDHLYNNWSDTDEMIPRNQIRFGYKVNQNVVLNARHALKCYDGGTEEPTDIVNNDSMRKEVTIVKIVLESRTIHNLGNNTPPELYQMKKKIRDVINGNRLGLKDKGIHLVTLAGNEETTRDEATTSIYRLVLFVRCMQLLEKKVVTVTS